MHLTLKILAGKHVGKELRITKDRFLIGRGEECHLRPISGEVSRLHCEITLEGNVAYIRDLGSTNGSFVNGVAVPAKKALANGDVIIVGPLMFEAHLPTTDGFAPADETAERTEWAISDAEAVSLSVDDSEPSAANSNNRLAASTRILSQSEVADLVHEADLAGIAPATAPANSPQRQTTAEVEGKRPTAILRHFGVKPPPPSSLQSELWILIDTFRSHQPGLTWGEVRSAVRHLMVLVDQKIQDEQPN